ncbi:MAG TPA: DUF3606 domain-containing protein [Candidatus Limnocylindria bacterium]|nr:DUF3606 domain-containing protein [Candidatus Limnocylindria bacterium]
MHADYEAACWTRKWGVTAAALKSAVAKVGVSADAIEKQLKG